MRVLVFHGYLLGGTGSNVYNASLARALAALGHDVHLLCQDRHAARLPWVRAVGSWEGDSLEVRELREPGRGGRITAYVPDIGRLLPVYVMDRYAGFDARPFPELSHRQVEDYVEANVRAVQAVAARCGGFDAALVNHLIMGPCILARADVGDYAVKIHGSALEYTVRPHPDRFLSYAREGVAGARAVLVGSRHTAESLWSVLDDPALPARTRLGPPGVDTERFRPRERAAARRALREASEALERRARAGEEGEAGAGEQSSFARDPRQAAATLTRVADSDRPWVAFVGKLIVSKGLDLLVVAWPLVRAQNPEARLVVVGFGAWRRELEGLLAALADGDLRAAREIAAHGRRAEDGPAGKLRMLDAFLASPPDGYADAARAAASSIELAGRLEHEEVADLLPAVESVVFPSTFPESFGMVSAEAAACGALPISAGHSGLAEVSRELARAVSPDVSPLLSFPLDGDPVRGIAARLTAWLSLDPARRRQEGARLAAVVRERWGWETVARGVLAASAGRLSELPDLPELPSATPAEGPSEQGLPGPTNY